MGKTLIQQARGKGSLRYRAPSFRYAGKAEHFKLSPEPLSGIVMDIIHCQGHSAPLAQIKYEQEVGLIVAPEGICVGDQIVIGQDIDLRPGNVLALKDIPEGTLIHNIERSPGDGGKFVRAGGVFGKVVSQLGNDVVVRLPSKKNKSFNANCRASIGIVAGGGRLEKPFLKAGTMYHRMRARNKLYPIVGGGSQNAVDHPFGNARTSRKAKVKPVGRNAPPGRKVGMISPRRTGRKKR